MDASTKRFLTHRYCDLYMDAEWRGNYRGSNYSLPLEFSFFAFIFTFFFPFGASASAAVKSEKQLLSAL